jgi:hypothetical protein
VEKYEFTSIRSEEQGLTQPVILYQAAYSYNNAGWQKSLDFSGLLLQNYFEKSCPLVSDKSVLLNCLVE